MPYNIGYAIGSIIGFIVSLGIKFVEFLTVDVPNFVTGFISWISQLPGQIWTYITDIIGKVAEFALNLISKGYEAGSNFVSSIISFVSGLPGQIWSVLSNAIGKVAEFVVKMGSKGLKQPNHYGMVLLILLLDCLVKWQILVKISWKVSGTVSRMQKTGCLARLAILQTVL